MRKPSELTAEFGENITWAFRRDVSSVIMKTEFKGAALTPYGDREYNYEIRVEDGHGWIGLLTIKTQKSFPIRTSSSLSNWRNFIFSKT